MKNGLGRVGAHMALYGALLSAGLDEDFEDHPSYHNNGGYASDYAKTPKSKATIKRRKANKQARKARRINRKNK